MPRFLAPFDLGKNELQNAKIHPLAADPAPAAADKGLVWFNTTSNLFRGWDGTAVQNMTSMLESLVGSGAISITGVVGKSQTVSIAAASGAVPGTMAAADFTKLAGAASAATASALVQRDVNGDASLRWLTAAKVTGLSAPAAATDAATKSYVDSVASGLNVKASVRVASVGANVVATYANTGGVSARGQMTAMTNTLDGVALALNDRVLLKNQTAGDQNGIWVVSSVGTGANGVWDRASDFSTDAQVTDGSFTFVSEGAINQSAGWILTTNNPIIIGGAAGTVLVFAQFSGNSSYAAGNGLSLVGNAFTVVGTAGRVSVSAAGVDIAATYLGQASITTLGTITTGVWTGTAVAVANGGTGAVTAAAARTALAVPGKFAVDVGTGAATSITVTHNLNTLDVTVTIYDKTALDEVWCTVVHLTVNTVRLDFSVAPAANALRAVVTG